MVGVIDIQANNEIFYLNMIKAKENDFKELNHKSFVFFEKSYAVAKQMNLYDIIEMDDDFIDFVSDLDYFVALNDTIKNKLGEIIDDCITLDIIGNKSISDIAKEYNIKVKSEELKKPSYLVKIIAMAFSRKIKKDNIKINDTILPEKNDVVLEIEDDFSGVIIEGCPVYIDFSKDYSLSNNSKKLLEIFQIFATKQEEIFLNKFIPEKCNNFKVFFTLMTEFKEKNIISNEILTNLKMSYFNLASNSRYQDFIKNSMLQGFELEIMKEQIDLLYHLKTN